MEILDLNSPQFLKLLESLDHLEDKLSELVLAEATKMWLTPKQVCMELGISRRTLQRYRDCQGLEHSRVGEKVFYSREMVNHFISKNIHFS